MMLFVPDFGCVCAFTGCTGGIMEGVITHKDVTAKVIQMQLIRKQQKRDTALHCYLLLSRASTTQKIEKLLHIKCRKTFIHFSANGILSTLQLSIFCQ